VAGIDVRHLGDFIREQRDLNNISLRQLARLAGVSNPYLSQIERGLRKPSAEILQQIAKALRISAEALYVQAGILEQREGSGLVADAVLADEGLSERQKQVLLEIYDSFRKENAAAPTDQDDVSVSVVTATTGLPDGLSTAGDGAAGPAPVKRSRGKRAASSSGGTAGTAARPSRPRRRSATAPQRDAPDAD
jgi:transcriptional regulator with XRE-family HTH domain